MNPRTTLLAIAALGLLATGFTATASASEATCDPQTVHDVTYDCRKAIEDEAEETCSQALPGYDCEIVDPCTFVSTPCDIQCTCDPILDNLLPTAP